MNKRLLRDPDYNKKRRKGGGIEHLEICQCCQLPVPTLQMRDEGAAIPCSPYHVRCVRCLWPVERAHISPYGTCVMCMGGAERRRYYRRHDARCDDELGPATTPNDEIDDHIESDSAAQEELLAATRLAPATKTIATRQGGWQKKQQVLFRQFDKPKEESAVGSAPNEKVITTRGRKRREATVEDPADIPVRYRESPHVSINDNGMVMEQSP